MCFQMGSEKWQCLDHPNRVGQLIPQSCHCHRETYNKYKLCHGVAGDMDRKMRDEVEQIGFRTT